jgi:hypothetical protein
MLPLVHKASEEYPGGVLPQHKVNLIKRNRGGNVADGGIPPGRPPRRSGVFLRSDSRHLLADLDVPDEDTRETDFTNAVYTVICRDLRVLRVNGNTRMSVKRILKIANRDNPGYSAVEVVGELLTMGHH